MIHLDLSGEYLISPLDCTINNTDHKYLVLRYDDKAKDQKAILDLMTQYSMDILCTNELLCSKIAIAIKEMHLSNKTNKSV